MSDEFNYCNQRDCVSRETLYKEFKRHFTAPKDWRKLAKIIIDATPPADVAPVIHGHWKNVKRVLNTEWGACSNCDRGNELTRYCPYCGAKMGEESEDTDNE